jgi:hypothetical protein
MCKREPREFLVPFDVPKNNETLKIFQSIEIPPKNVQKNMQNLENNQRFAKKNRSDSGFC